MLLIASNSPGILKEGITDLERLFEDRDVKRVTSQLIESLESLLCFPLQSASI